jgi:2-(1,2-epoxy-1,2-dihydrophenyl)acetyl-CoA isomerase
VPEITSLETVEWERRDAVAVLSLNRPDRLNALSGALVDEVVGTLASFDPEGEVRAVVLAAKGRAFSAGGDLGDIAEQVAGDREWPRLRLLRRLQRLVSAIRDCPLPVVAAVHGPVYGAGWSAVLACDLVVAAEDARFCQVFVRRDLVPDLGSAWLLPRVVGLLRAKELMLLGDELSASDAHALGLVNRIAATREEAVNEAVVLAARAASASPATVALIKSLVHDAQAGTLESALRIEEHAQAIALGAPQSRAALAGFMAGRGG